MFDSSGLTFADAAFATQHRDGTMMRQAIALASLAGGTAVAIIAAWRCQRLHPAQPTTTATLSPDNHFEETTLNTAENVSFTDAVLRDVRDRLASRDRADYKVLVSLVVVAWKLGDLTTAREIAKTEPREKKCSQEGTRGDEVKDLLARMQDPNKEPTYEEVLEAYTTSRCDDKNRHPDELWEEYIPECEGEEPVRWGFDPGM